MTTIKFFNNYTEETLPNVLWAERKRSDDGIYYLKDIITDTCCATVQCRWHSEIMDVLPTFTMCRSCGRLVRKNDESKIGDGYLCPSCMASDTVICAHCGKRVYEYSTIMTADTGVRICRDCRKNLTRCRICGKFYENPENITYLEEYKMYICNDCDIEDFDPIDGYHTMKDNGDYSFYTDAPRTEKLCMGFELETTSENEDDYSRTPYARHIWTMLSDFLHFEEDCSIGDGGFEMISQPATLDHILSQRADKLKEAFAYLSANGYTSHNGGKCGFHIHVDREFFGAQEDSCIAKIIFLMMKHRDNFMRFSRRRDRQLGWCHLFDENRIGDIPLLVKEGYDGSRYMALNLTNDNTLEFRLWRGTLRYETFIATLKFTDRICNLVKDKTVMELNSMSWEDILGEDEDIKAYWATRNPSPASSNS